MCSDLTNQIASSVIYFKWLKIDFFPIFDPLKVKEGDSVAMSVIYVWSWKKITSQIRWVCTLDDVEKEYWVSF